MSIKNYYDNLCPIEKALNQTSKLQFKSSARVTYDRFPFDPDYKIVYTDFRKGVHRSFNPIRPGDWGMKLIIQCFKHHLQRRSHVLDIGTGVGWPAYWIEKNVDSVVAVDESIQMIKLAKLARKRWPKSKLKLICASGESLPFPDGSFDAVIMDAVLEFTQDPLQILREIRRVLQLDGIVINKTTNWKTAFERKFGGFKGGSRILYPKSEAKTFLIDGRQVFKYRRCLFSPPQERTYFVGFEDFTNINKLVQIINKGLKEEAASLIYKLGVTWVEVAICHQFVPDTLQALFESENFKIETIHGCREIGNKFASRLKQRRWFGFYRFQFESLTDALVSSALYSDPHRGLDMILIATQKNK